MGASTIRVIKDSQMVMKVLLLLRVKRLCNDEHNYSDTVHNAETLHSPKSGIFSKAGGSFINDRP